MAKKPNEKMWEEAASEVLKGRTITKVRYMTVKEADEEGWMRRPLVIVLDDGTQIYASRDDEGNDAGTMFGQDGNDGRYRFPSL